jgi:phosphatidylethanolamine/phosphatidyl-N-methylethanolamine N-methyltransferase
MHIQAVASAYDRLAPAYDFLFGSVFRQGRSSAVKAANRIGGTILEVGIGTGLSLAQYARNCRVIGIDISIAMLRRARRRVADGKLSHVTRLELMNAEELRFPESSFDAVVAQYVISAVPNPERALSELARVLRPGGEIIITSRIGAENGVRAKFEHWLMPVTSRLGWRTEFPWRRFADWAASMPDITLLEHRRLPPLGHFSLIRYAKRAETAAKAN